MNLLVESGTIRNQSSQHRRTTVCRQDALNALGSLRLHWPEYLMEAGEPALYMFFACAFAILLQHPALSVRRFIVSAVIRRALMGLSRRRGANSPDYRRPRCTRQQVVF